MRCDGRGRVGWLTPFPVCLFPGIGGGGSRKNWAREFGAREWEQAKWEAVPDPAARRWAEIETRRESERPALLGTNGVRPPKPRSARRSDRVFSGNAQALKWGGFSPFTGERGVLVVSQVWFCGRRIAAGIFLTNEFFTCHLPLLKLPKNWEGPWWVMGRWC